MTAPTSAPPGTAPRISVVTVCWNSAATIEDTLRSVAGQTHPDVEHVVIDGASSDRTLEIVKRFPHVARLVSERDRGIYDAMNKGLALATGEIIGTLNADDFYADNDALAQVAAAFADPSVEIVYGDLCYVGEHDTSRIVRYWRSSDFQPGLFRHGWCPPHPSFFVRRTAYERYGNFDLSYRIASDVDLTMRFLEVHRARARHIPRVLVSMRMGGTTNRSLRNILNQNREIWRSMKKHGLRPGLATFLGGKILSRATQFLRRPSANG
jgi:glycosyltransferase involved in cell wall biosynthesis